MTFTPPPPGRSDSPSGTDCGTGAGRTRRSRTVLAAGAVVLALAAAGGLYLALRGDDGKPAAAPSPSPSAHSASPSPSPSPSSSPKLPYVVLKPGTCFDHPNLTKGLRQVTERPCDRPHDGEAIANVTVRGTLRNDAQIALAVRKDCASAVRAKVRQQGGGHFYGYVLTPTANLYHQGYNQATCTLTASDTVGGKKLTAGLR